MEDSAIVDCCMRIIVGLFRRLLGVRRRNKKMPRGHAPRGVMSVPSWQICQQSTVADGVIGTMGCIDARHFNIIEEGGALSDGKVLIRSPPSARRPSRKEGKLLAGNG